MAIEVNKELLQSIIDGMKAEAQEDEELETFTPQIDLDDVVHRVSPFPFTRETFMEGHYAHAWTLLLRRASLDTTKWLILPSEGSPFKVKAALKADGTWSEATGIEAVRHNFIDAIRIAKAYIPTVTHDGMDLQQALERYQQEH